MSEPLDLDAIKNRYEDRGDITISQIDALMAEVERLRAENASLQPKPVCSLCRGTGRITKTESGESWASVMTLPCPAGCPPLTALAMPAVNRGNRPALCVCPERKAEEICETTGRRRCLDCGRVIREEIPLLNEDIL